MRVSRVFVILVLLCITACQQDTADTEQPSAGAATGITPDSWPGMRVFDRSSFADHVKILASDEFGGREPGTAGETKTIDYISMQYEAAGLEPVIDGGYLQPVPLVRVTGTPGEELRFMRNDISSDLVFKQDIVIWSARTTEHVELRDSDMVFVGYGIVAPEYDWNDYEGLDVRGKTVVILVNDPGYATQDDSLFKGNIMTYYGRWTYKYEEAARQGAAAALIVHNVGGAGYGWNVVQGGSRPSYYLDQGDGGTVRSNIEGWLNEKAAKRLFESIGTSLDTEMSAAMQRGFKGHELQATFTASIDNQMDKLQSNNVIGVLPGSDRAHEAIVYVAHWDHLGEQESDDDGIFNGAIDNATGVAGVIELAKAFSERKKAFSRSVVFIAVTAEESGLLGSKYYAQNPVYPLRDTVAAINIDSMVITGPTHDLAVVGYKSSQLEDLASPIARRQGRTIRPEPSPEKGYFFRSDHINFARMGVPAFYAESGLDDRQNGFEWGQQQANDYRASVYHQASDEFDISWNMGAALEDLQLYYELGAGMADSDDFPEWYADSEFRAAREASRNSLVE